jgi:CelD/BcsL family acetyltransferase involved in cellulose biosynthesis
MLILRDETELKETTEAGGLEALRPAWEALWQAVEDSTPFQFPGWLIPWWRHLGQGKLQCLSFWQGEQLCGLAPFYIYTRPADGKRQLLLLGSGNSDYLDILVRPGHEPFVLNHLGAWLAASQDRWDIAEFLQLRPSSPLLRLPLSRLSCEFSEDVALQDCCPALALPAAPQDHWDFFQKPCFTKLDYYWRRAARTCTVQIQSSSLESLERSLDALIHFEETRWSRRGLQSVLNDPATQRFHCVACYNFCAAGLLRLYTLHLDGRIVAVFYGFHHRTHTYFYLAGFDAEFSKVSPGKLILAYAIERAVREGATVFDFLRGREAYKYEWGAEDTPAFRRALWVKNREVGYEHSPNGHQTRCF